MTMLNKLAAVQLFSNLPFKQKEGLLAWIDQI